MIIVGIDPGAHGGIAAIDGSGRVFLSVKPMPLLDGEVDVCTIWKWFSEWRPDAIWIEHVHAMPKQGVTSMFSFGANVGMLHAVSKLYLNQPNNTLKFVSPQRWMKALHLPGLVGTTKERSIATARKLFPKVDFLATSRSRVPHDGMVEALLVAEFGRQASMM